MSVVDAIPLLLGDEGYNISRSVRLRSSASAFFSRTPSSAGNRRTWTLSAWVKRGALGTVQGVLKSGVSSYVYLYFNSNDTLYFDVNTGSVQGIKNTSAVYRDPSAWYHIVAVCDTTQATALNRMRLYVNGSEITAWATNSVAFSQNYDTEVNNTTAHNLGTNVSGTQQFDGYLTEVNFVDGQALTPSSFGETDVLTGVWKPKKYAGTYGTNGFYLNFSDNSNNTATTIGKDYSGNGNNWTPNNISVTSGVTYDSMIDVPTQWADGGNGRGNYATLNPLQYTTATANSGNLQTSAFTLDGWIVSTMGVSSGKWYCEITPTAFTVAQPFELGIARIANMKTGGSWTTGDTLMNQAVTYDYGGNKRVLGTSTAYGASYTTNDVIGIAFDVDAGQITFYKNNTSQGVISQTLTGFDWCVVVANQRGGGCTSTYAANFGQRPFAYTPPTGFKALNTQNLPAPTILKGNQWFDVALYSGGSGDVSVTGLGFTPDLSWIKCRNQAFDHGLYDAVRGVQKELQSNTTLAETTQSTGLKSFDSAGFTVGGRFSGSGNNYTSWNWKESATAGFDIVTFTRDSSGTQNVSHNLGVKPAMVIIKARSTTSGWNVWHQSMDASPNNFYMALESTAAKAGSTAWCVPSSTNVGVTNFSNGVTSVMYTFAEVAGFSRFGSYTGNGSSDGPFVFTGMRSRYILVKRTDAVDSWQVYDTARDTFNTTAANLYPNLSNAEVTDNSGQNIDILSNGFKLRNTNARLNASGGTYIFAAFAENPFKNALAR